ncbi:MAG: D-alanyl-D-alanine carboxypeptidase family protein [Alphaproteobacteria bacterium]
MKKIILFLSLLLISTQANAFETKAKNVILIDADTGAYLLTKNHQIPTPPASMSKLMTTYIILSKLKEGSINLDDKFSVSENAWRKGGAASGGSTMFLPVNSEATVADLLKGITIVSGNDACIVAAENIAGSEEAFAIEMNKTAQKLGLKASHFANSTGLPHPDHKMSVEDLSILAKAIINEFPEHYSIFKEKFFTYNGIKQSNRNPLLYSMPEADGLKTGHTEEAGFCLTATAKRDDRRLIFVMTGLNSNKERSEEAQNIMNYGFRTFDNYNIFSQGQNIITMPVALGVRPSIEAIINQDVKVTTKKIDFSNIKATAIYNSPLQAPIKQGDKIGTLKIEIPKQDSIEVDLIANSSVAKIGKVKQFFANLKYLILGE